MTKTRLRARVKLLPVDSLFYNYDTFINSLSFLDKDQSCRLIIVGNEIIDNLLTHSEINPTGLHVLVHKNETSILLAFFVQSHEKFLKFSKSNYAKSNIPLYFDKNQKRWRGMGLRMCRNVSKSISFRADKLIDSIFVFF